MTRTRTVLTAAVAAVLVAVPTAAQAADFQRYSTTGRSFISYDSAARGMTLCDRVNGDGIGAYYSVTNDAGHSYAYIEYNGCGRGPDSVPWGYHTVRVCDWMVNGQGNRYEGNCRSWAGWL